MTTARGVVAAAGVAAVLVIAASTLLAQSPTLRKVYVTAADSRGLPVLDLATADLALKEGGKDREIVSVRPSTARLRVAIALTESLTGDTSARSAIFDFVRQVRGIANVGIFVLGRRSVPALLYTADLDSHLKAINGLPMSAQIRDENFVEGILEITKDLEKTDLGRRVIVALAIEREAISTIPADHVLDEFAKSGTLFYAATLWGGSSSGSPAEALERSAPLRVIGDGSRQTGGRRIESARTSGLPPALAQIGDELLHQYEVTYSLPAGVKPDARLSVSAKRKGITLRSPSRIPVR